jgi:membrane-associated phospholipid phosphatase
LMYMVSWIGFAPQAFIFPLLIGMLLHVLDLRWEGAAAVFAAFAVGLLNAAIKIIVHRPRPSQSLVQVAQVLNSYSFPSGHVMFYTCFFGFLFFLVYTLLRHSWLRTLLLVFFGALVMLVGISRVYLGEHWASDVLGGYLLGSLALIASIAFYHWGMNRFFKGRLPADRPSI